MSNVGVVIPVGPGREENLRMTLGSLAEQTIQPAVILLVFDGPEATISTADLPRRTELHFITTDRKHEPGLEQPRNVGVRTLPDKCKDVWFIDSDIVLRPDAHAQLLHTRTISGEDCIIIAPYDWLPEHLRDFTWDGVAGMHNDPRWPSFEEYPADYVSRGKLNDGLACFSGNLMWSRAEFERVGGFWNEIHHGRCEDGELGLRAVAEGVPIAFCREARGFHLAHPINTQLAMQRNARDVPMLNARHPWVEQGGLVVVDKDGKRFDQRCPACQTLINTIDYWTHTATCGAALVLPDGLA